MYDSNRFFREDDLNVFNKVINR